MLTLPPSIDKTDLAALLKADDICVHLTIDHPQGLVRAIKRKRHTPKDPFAQDVEHRVTATATIDNYRGQEAFDRGGVKCFELLGVYASQKSHVYSVLRTLRVGDQLVFRFYPDGHNNGYGAAGRIHVDALYLDVYRKGHLYAKWLLDTGVGENNSARMCSGVPFSKDHQKCADTGSPFAWDKPNVA